MMKAYLLNRVYDLTKENNPLAFSEIPVPEPGEGQLLIRVGACGVCHTEIDEIEGRAVPWK